MYTIFTWDICRRKTKNKARELKAMTTLHYMKFEHEN